MNKLQHLFDKNTAWAEKITQNSPDFFTNSAKGQTPEYLWIGCSDSRVPANKIFDLNPGELFVHRNIANVVGHTYLSCLSVIQYAVEVLKVKHIIVCGHYGCGGVKASLEQDDHGFIDNWLQQIKDVRSLNSDKLDGLDDDAKFKKLCELNVLAQVKNVCNTTIVQDAWKNGAKLSVHSLIYNLENGLLKDLGNCISSINEHNKN